jgi:CHAT domain-containing protein
VTAPSWKFCVIAAFLISATTWLLLQQGSFERRTRTPAERPELRALVAAVGQTRAVEGRLTGGFAWAPVEDSRRGPGSSPSSRPVSVQLAAVRLSEQSSDQSAARLADRASGLLVLGQTDDAIETLEEAVELPGVQAAHWSDLAAARLERFRRDDRTIDLPRALDAIERAIATDPLPEALFNRALILEHLNLLTPAKEAWLRYLDVDAASPWAAEARSRREDLDRRSAEVLAAAQTQRVREQLADETLWRWAAEADSGSARLEEGRRAALQLSEASRDGLARDMILAIDQAQGRPAILSDLKAAHLAFGRARAAYKKDDFTQAERDFAAAEQRASRTSKPLALLTRLNRAILRYRFDDVDGAIASLRTIVAEAPADALSIKGRSYWILGLLTALRGGGREAVQFYELSLTSLRDAAERPNAAFVEMLRAALLDGFGNAEGAWRARISALSDTDRESAVQSAALAASEAEWPRAAGALYEIVTAMARAQQREIVQVEAIRGRARALALAGAFDEGLSVLAEARRIAAGKTGPGWDLLKAEIDLAESECVLAQSPANAEAAATRALEYFTAAKRDSRFPEVRLARARAHRDQGHTEQAEADLLAGIDGLERTRGQLDEWRLSALMGDVIQRSADQLVSMRVEAGRTDEAFDIAERLRGWTLRASVHGGRPALRLHELTSAVPDGSLTAWFYVSTNETYVWVIRRGDARFLTIPVNHAQLTRLVTSHAKGDRTASSQLHKLLLEPLSAELTATKLLVVVPDGPLHQLQFAALPGLQSRFLIEERAVLVSPNATMSVSMRGPASGEGKTRSALVIGNPAFDRRAFPELREIRESSHEASSVASLYERSRTLSGAEASRTPILSALPQFEVFHFAGHSVANIDVPAASQLVVSGTGEDAITASDISRLPLQGLKLAVLSSCQSAIGAATRSEGPLGLAQAFLSAGAQSVVASLAPVADRATRELSVAFHREYQRTGDPVGALQAAQRAMLAGKDPALSAPEAWAPFVIVGAGSARFN